MKVEVLEVKLSSDGFVGEKGDMFTVPDDVGAAWCKNGWARDVSGTVETGERSTKPVTINPKKMIQKQNAQEVK